MRNAFRSPHPTTTRETTVAADQVQFPPEGVQQHAATVDGIADAVRSARSAVHEVTMDTQAYGVFCQFLPTILSPIFALAIGAFDDAEDSLRETATNLRAVVGSTTATDESAAHRLRQLPELPL
jgi:hypothetical protein